MYRIEMIDLLKQIKIFYPRFDNVEKLADGRFRIDQKVIDAWYDRIGWMEYEIAYDILNMHLESKNGAKIPTISTWLNAGKRQEPEKPGHWCSAHFDSRRKVLIWQPKPGSKPEEYRLKHNEKDNTWEDSNGYIWTMQGE